MPRNEQLIRQHRLLQLLERPRRGWTLTALRDALALQLGLRSLHPKTVQRDLAALAAAGFDIQTQQRPEGKCWRLGPRSRQVFRVQATASELIALSLGRDLLLPLAGTPLGQALESFWSRLKEELPPGVWKHYQTLREMLHVQGLPAKSYARQEGLMRVLARAILQRRVVLAEYQSPGKPPRHRRIEPLALVVHQASLYLVGADHDLPPGSDRLRRWKLERLLRATPQDAYFVRPPEQALAAYLGPNSSLFAGGAPQTYVVQLSPRAARWVQEDPWHPQQQLRFRPDGSAQLRLPAHHLWEIVPRVLALGTEAELLAPAEARGQIRQIVEQLAQRYGNPPCAASQEG
jgi:predicted DNA-binding transcriptional regulator YafY